MACFSPSASIFTILTIQVTRSLPIRDQTRNYRRDARTPNLQAVPPVLHLNGYKIANPTILARIPHQELEQLFRGYGYEPYVVEGSDPDSMHQAMAATLEHCVREIRRIQRETRASGSKAARPCWPMVILRSLKGWTGPKEVDGHKVEG
ncbi:MAG: hypothetical protein JOZ58_20905, partial [Acetobacteraceae bacterium]|nr:hypothetical protein [Acetobacteraceae bacterium]